MDFDHWPFGCRSGHFRRAERAFSRKACQWCRQCRAPAVPWRFFPTEKLGLGPSEDVPNDPFGCPFVRGSRRDGFVFPFASPLKKTCKHTARGCKIRFSHHRSETQGNDSISYCKYKETLWFQPWFQSGAKRILSIHSMIGQFDVCLVNMMYFPWGSLMQLWSAISAIANRRTVGFLGGAARCWLMFQIFWGHNFGGFGG